jgi:hypothetical protein
MIDKDAFCGDGTGTPVARASVVSVRSEAI